MNRKNCLLTALTGAAMAFALAACSEKDDYESYPPTWKGFRIEKDGQAVTGRTVIKPGDEITVTAVQAQKGHLINATNYYWALSLPVYADNGEDVAGTNCVLEFSSHTNYDGVDNSDPQCKFRIPDNAYCGMELYPTRPATITFEAKYNFSANGVHVENGQYDISLSGNITPYSGTTSGGARGTLKNLYVHSNTCTHVAADN